MTAEPDTAPRARPLSKRGWWIASGVMLVVAAVPWISFGDGDSDAPDVVTAYLEAARRGDVETALDLAGTHPKGEKARFLSPDAVSDDWRVTEVVETSYYDRDYGDDQKEEATVQVAIETTAGEKATTGYELTRAEGEAWKITDPLVKVNFEPNLLWYIDVNGATAPYPAPKKINEDEIETNASYRLLPGAYRFFADPPDTVEWRDEKPESTPLLFGDVWVRYGEATITQQGQAYIPEFELSKTGHKAVTTAMRDYIDGCAAIFATAVSGCPFGIEHVPDPRDDDYYLDTLKQLEWSIEEYPTIAAVAESGAVTITDRQRGTAKLAVVGIESEDSPGTEVETEVKCDIKTSRLEAGILPDGSIRIYPEGARFRLAEFDRDPILWKTCDS